MFKKISEKNEGGYFFKKKCKRLLFGQGGIKNNG